MISKHRLLVAGLTGLLVCFSAGAQTHGSAPSGRMTAGHVRSTARTFAVPPGAPVSAPRAIVPTARQANVTFISPNGRVTSEFAPLGNFGDFENDGVPGLGFDYVHLAAISGAMHNGSSFRFGHHEHNIGGSFVPIFFGGYPFYYDEPAYEQPAQQAQAQPQPQIIVIQQPVPAQPAAETGGEAASPAAATPAPATPENVRDVGEFVLVRRDGRILFASMFSVVREQVLYVTPEGMRHTVPVSDLDADATEQMNEARGTTVQIHN